MKRLKFLRIPAVIVLLSLLPGLVAAHRGHDQIFVFGDSLSDPGNAYYLLGRALTPPYDTLDALLVPDAPYAIGGHHFSNGPTWIEQLARSLHHRSAAEPAFAPSARGHSLKTNYAIGSARARDIGSGTDMTEQVNTYLARYASPPGTDDLYVIEFGGNDVRDAIAALASDPSGTTSAEILKAALTAISDNLASLYASGARTFLITNSADISLTPSIRILDVISPGSGMAAAIISAQFNAGLDTLISQIETQLPDVTITKFDIYRLLHTIVADPGGFHLSDATDACIMPGIPPYSCRMAKRYLFWDGVHPTRAGHAIFAKQARSLLYPDDGFAHKGRKHSLAAHVH
ncbi:MAG: SGNH/GDSL hydrolase family protein [Candidatus Thiodiazotropha sp.]